MRTDAEKLEFAKACERIEKRGGDVLAYVEWEYPSYSPRATWYMLQREYLHRTKLTEGRPKEKRGEKEMGKMMDTANEVMDAYARGESIYDWLEAHGYKNPSSMWFQMKKAAKKVDPDLYDRMCDAITSTKRKPKAQRTVEQLTPPPKPKEEPKEIPQAGEPMPVTVHGKQVTTCCAPARESGVEVPDELPEEEPKTVEFNGKKYEKLKPVKMTNMPFDPRNPENSIPGKVDMNSIEVYVEKKSEPKPEPKPEPMEIVGVRSRVKGYYMKAEVNTTLANGAEYVHLIWRDLVTREERSIGLSVEEWKRLAEEIPQAMKQLGF